MTITRVHSSAPFSSVLEQMDEELKWLALRLRVVIERARHRRAVGPPAEYRGLYVTDEEVDTLLTTADAEHAGLDELIDGAALLREELDARCAASLESGVLLPLEAVSRQFGLRREERLLLLIAIAPYFDAGYEKVYAYANDDIAKRWPTVGLALQVLSDDREDMLALRPLFLDDAPLSRHQMLVLGGASSPTPALLNRQVALDVHMAEVLLGHRGLDPRLRDFCRSVDPAAGAGPFAQALLAVLSERLAARIYLGGRWQAEKEEALAGACSQLSLGVIAVNTPALARMAEMPALVSLLLRDACLERAALLFLDWGTAAGDAEGSALSQCLVSRLADHPLPVAFSDRAADPPHPPVDLHLHLDYPSPGYEQRQQSWTSVVDLDEADAAKLAAMYRLGLREVRAAGEMATSLAAWRGSAVPSIEDVKTAARTQSQPRLTSLAQKITPRFTWEDIVLPPDRMAQLREIANQVLYQHVVYEEWGLATKSSLGRGVAALFAGQSGTGKTMAAEIIGQELGLEVYKIDLAGLVSKYIGETEKNLARVFEEASDTNAILFFDEADAVFGKRSEVRDSHDRYANIEVSYLLQRMEEYDGIVVLATNLRANLDDAFLRRMRAIVEFPFPEIEDRLRIWQRTLASAAPLADDVDLQAMARQFRIAGGNIRNIIMLAAFLAASAGNPISMSHLIQGAKREYQKLGRLITESDFGRWYAEARA